MSLDEPVEFYAAKPVSIEDPVILIRINQIYRRDMSGLELIEATRGVWKVGVRREAARFAFAVFHGIVREVYEIRKWHPALTLEYKTRHDLTKSSALGRWEFDGVVAEDRIRIRYIHKSVGQYLSRGNQSPTVYVNV